MTEKKVTKKDETEEVAKKKSRFSNNKWICLACFRNICQIYTKHIYFL